MKISYGNKLKKNKEKDKIYNEDLGIKHITTHY